MSWARLDDNFWMHPKILMAGNSAAGVFARMLSYCGCYLTDGLVPEPVVDQIVGKDRKALEALEKQGMVARMESGLLIKDYLKHNPSKAEVEETVRARREAGRKGGHAKARARANA